MNFKRSPIEQPSTEAVDAVVDAYVAWREQSAAVRIAYARWSSAGLREREGEFVRYRIALDCEERAADRYQSLVDSISQPPGSQARSLAQP